MNKLAVVAFSVGLCGMAAYPAVSGRDSFPFSNYPMFAAERGAPLIHQVVVTSSGGASEVLSPRFLGTSEVLQAKVLVRQAVGRGKRAARRLCREVADRVRGDTSYPDAQHIEIRGVRYDPIDYFERPGGPVPLQDQRVVRCPVSKKAIAAQKRRQKKKKRKRRSKGKK